MSGTGFGDSRISELMSGMRTIQREVNNAQNSLDDLEYRARNGDAEATAELNKTAAQLRAEGKSEERIVRLHEVRDKVFRPDPPMGEEGHVAAAADAAVAAARAHADAIAALAPQNASQAPLTGPRPRTMGVAWDVYLHPSDRIRLASTEPHRFRIPEFDLDKMDVHRQEVTLQARPPTVETPRTIPLLVWAIENGASETTVHEIAQVYQQEYPQGLDSIWGAFPRKIRPPLAAAVKFGRPDVIKTLLFAGANPKIRCAEDPATTFSGIETCSRRGYPHTRCIRDGVVTDDRMCDDPLRGGLRTMRFSSARHREHVRPCVKVLFDYNGRIDILATPTMTTDEFKWAIEFGFSSYVVNSMKDIMALPDADQKKVNFVARLDDILVEILLGHPYQPNQPGSSPNPITIDGGHDEMINYLLDIGAKPKFECGMSLGDRLWRHDEARPLNCIALRRILAERGLDDQGNPY